MEVMTIIEKAWSLGSRLNRELEFLAENKYEVVSISDPVKLNDVPDILVLIVYQ